MGNKVFLLDKVIFALGATDRRLVIGVKLLISEDVCGTAAIDLRVERTRVVSIF